MRERTVEVYLCAQAKRAGGRAFKWSSPGQRGVPDRLVIMPGGRVTAVEVKAPGKAPRKLQALVLRELRQLGVNVAVVDCHAAVDELMEGLR